MADNLREPFVNPYVDEAANEARFSAVVSMDEAHERWNNGQWNDDKTNFALDASFFAEDEAQAAPTDQHPDRFRFDLQEYILQSSAAAPTSEHLNYTDSYRPQGNISDGMDNLTLTRLRYNALADIPEELPEDLSYLYGGHSERQPSAKHPARTRSYERLHTSVDKRRAAIDQMMPDEQRESPEQIMADIKRRREIEDAKSGITRRPEPRRYTKGIYETYPEPGTLYDGASDFVVETVTERGSWRGDLPQQDGLVPDSKSLPQFGRFSRTWSEMESLDPSRSEMLRHTVNTIYDDEPSSRHNRRFRPGHNGVWEYGVSDEEFDPDDRYRRLRRQRRSVQADSNVLEDRIMSGAYSNPYVETSSEQLQSLLRHDMRGPGHLPDPEGLTDPALIYEWNMGYSRINAGENRYAAWLAEQGRLAEQAEQSRYRGSHRPGLPGAYMQREKPFGESRRYPHGTYRERDARRRDIAEQMQRATEQGMADGREIIRRQQEEQRKRAREQYERQQKQLRQQQEYYRRQQEQMMRQQQAYAGRQPYAGMPQGQQSNQRTQAQPRTRTTGTTARRTVQAPQYGPWGFYTPPRQESSAATPAGRTKKQR